MTRDLYTLYQPDLEAASRGIPFLTSRGVTVWLLPDWAEEWDRCALDRAVLMKDYLSLDWWEMPADLREQISLREFETAVVAWDATDGLGQPLPCTVEMKRQIGRAIRPFRLEVLAEVRRRQSVRANAVAALGKDSGLPSEPSSSTPRAETAPPNSVP